MPDRIPLPPPVQYRASTALVANQPSAPQPILWDIFLAHASDDKAVARKLYALVGGRVRVFFDEESVALGADYDVTIRDAQRQSFMTVVLVGASSDSAYTFDPRHEGREAADPYGLNLKQGIELKSLDDLSEAVDRIVTMIGSIKRDS